MKLNYIILIGFFLFSFSKVYGQQLYSDTTFQKMQQESKSVRAKKKFKFSKKRHQKRIDFTKIDTNSIYVFSYSPISDSSEKHYRFYRFFKGAVFESGAYKSFPTLTEVENLSYGTWRCYTINRKGKIIIETPKRSEMDSRWIFYYGNIYDDRIELIYYRMSYPAFGSSPTKLQPSWVFYKQEVNFKNRIYKWD